MVGSLEEARSWLEKAEETLDAARALRDRGFYNQMVSASYYAMFYAAKAALVSDGVHSKKHSGVISSFGRLFAKTGRLDPRLHRALMTAYKDRQLTDYRIGSAAAPEAAADSLEEAEEFVAAVTAFLAT